MRSSIGNPEPLPPPDRNPNGWPAMTLLIGPIDSGKTTFLRNWYDTWHWGDGFLSIKRFSGSRLIGYDLQRLSTRESCPWARVVGEDFGGRKPWIEIGPFRMFLEGFTFAAEIVDAVMAKKTGPMILDEAGPLEIAGQGFAPLLKKLLAGKHPLLVSIRDFCLEEFLSRFSTSEPRIVPLDGRR